MSSSVEKDGFLVLVGGGGCGGGGDVELCDWAEGGE